MPLKSESLTRVHVQVLLGRILVATSFPVGAAITHGRAPELLTMSRFALATLLFAPYIAWHHGFTIPPARTLAGYAAIGACLAAFFWAMFAALRLTSALNAAKPVDFAREILPVLSNKCFVCHGPDAKKKDILRLDSFERVLGYCGCLDAEPLYF